MEQTAIKTNGKVQFSPYTREIDLDKGITSAIDIIRENTHHEVTFSKTTKTETEAHFPWEPAKKFKLTKIEITITEEL